MKASNPTVIGLFIIGGLVSFIAAILLFSSGIYFGQRHLFVLYFDESVNGLDIGAPVKLRGVQIGQVRRIIVQFDDQGRRVKIPVIISLEEGYLRRRNSLNNGDNVLQSRGSKKSIDLSRSSLVVGLVGVLKTDSLVTGKVFVELNYAPTNAETYLRIDPFLSYPEIPTRPSDLQNFGDHLMSVANGLGNIDYRGLVAQIQSAVQSIASADLLPVLTAIRRTADSLTDLISHTSLDELLAEAKETCSAATALIRSLSVHSDLLTDSLQIMANQATKSLKEIEDLLAENSPFSYRLYHFLTQMANSASALEAFFNFLEQNPDAFINGKYRGFRQ